MRVWLEIITLTIIVVGTLFMSFKALLFDRDIPIFQKILYGVVALSAMAHVLSRDYYLRFLGQCALPCEELTEKVPANADSVTDFNIGESNKNIIYWAAEENAEIVDAPMKAYGKWSNSGVTRSDENGNVTMKFRYPAQYKVPHKPGGPLKPHIHYRVCQGGGMIGRVQTKYI
jgi:hypothetical protein